MSSRSQTFADENDSRPLAWGRYVLDFARGELLRDGQPVKLRRQSYEALKYLSLNAGRLVSKIELADAVWPDSVSVSDDSVNHCIRDIRRAFGEDGRAYLRTVPGRGYMFMTMPPQRSAAPSMTVSKGSPKEASIDLAQDDSTETRIPIGKVALSAMAVIGIGAGVWLWNLHANRKWAGESIPLVRQLAAAQRFPEAYDLTLRVLQYMPSDSALMRLMSEVSDDMTITSTPPGATVYLRRMNTDNVQYLGVTPITHLTLARGEFIIKVSKPGYADYERTASSALGRMRLMSIPAEIRISALLIENTKSPAGMVFVPEGEHILRGFSRPVDARVNLGGYWIDKFEVSNQNFKKFIDQGSYLKTKLLPRVTAKSLVDKTGMPGPRSWSGGTFPEGRANFPVTSVSWYEAAAYCQAQRKTLPTLLQWEKAARGGMHTPFAVTLPWGPLDPSSISERANFESASPKPVDSFPFGMSPYGAYNMAGNVSEWTRNQWGDGYTTAGGSWTDPIYQFGGYGARSPMNAAETLGFRCAAPAEAGAEEGAMRFASAPEQYSYPVSTDRDFQSARSGYRYEKSPLNAAVVSIAESDAYRREEIDFNGYYGQRAKAFLYLPKNVSPPYQTIHFVSGTPWWYGVPVTHVMEDGSAALLPYVRSGRAVFLVVLKGFAGREPVGAYAHLEYGSSEHREILRHWTVDMQRGVDYLETRPDIDRKKIAFWNVSQYEYGAVFAAIDQRYAANIFVGTAVYSRLLRVPPELNPLFFFPHIRSPKLLMNGLYDDTRPIARAEPVWKLMREPKRRENFPGGHVPTPEIAVPVINRFLDQTLGPVHPR